MSQRGKMSVDMKILICGLGRMGKVHEKYIKSLNLKYSCYDPYRDDISDSLRLENITSDTVKEFSHVLISTPEGTHAELYYKFKDLGFYGKFLIEKPVIVNEKDKDIFLDSSVYSGMVERFNPAVDKLKSLVEVSNIVSMDFVRCSVKGSSNQRVDSFTDVGIHDIDLYLHITSQKDILSYQIFQHSNTFSLFGKSESGHLVRFLWSNETFSKERKVIVRQTDCTYEADLIEQTVRKFTSSKDPNSQGIVCQNFYVEKSSSIKNEIENFISNDGERVSSMLSHMLYLDIKKEKK